MSSFNNDKFTKVPADNYLANSCPPGMWLNIMPSVGRFKDSDLVPSVYMKGPQGKAGNIIENGNAQQQQVVVPAYNACYSKAPQTNYGMFKNQNVVEYSPTHSESCGSNLDPEGKMNLPTPKKHM